MVKFTNEQLEALLDAQEALNEKYTGKDWRGEIPMSSFLTALDTEVSEYLESSPRVGDNDKVKNNGWKWWKQNLLNDQQNQVIETIDVLHFGLSILMLLMSKKEILEMNESFCNIADDIHDFPIKFLMIYKSTLILNALELNKYEVFCNLMRLLNVMSLKCDRYFSDIYDGYYKKNALNAKRISEGYITGDYKKIDENGQEDNRKLIV